MNAQQAMEEESSTLTPTRKRKNDFNPSLLSPPPNSSTTSPHSHSKKKPHHGCPLLLFTTTNGKITTTTTTTTTATATNTKSYGSKAPLPLKDLSANTMAPALPPPPSTPSSLSSSSLTPSSRFHTPRTHRPRGGGVAACPQPPLSSSKKLRMRRASLRLRSIETQEMSTPHEAEFDTNLWLEKQERAFHAWLNHVLSRPMQSASAVCRISSFNGNRKPPSSSSSMHSFSDNGTSFSSLASSTSTKGLDQIHGRKISGLANPLQCKTQPPVSTPSQALDKSLHAICSVPVLSRRLEVYFDAQSRDIMISTITRLAKYIDEGRLRLKEGCILLTDIALKEKAIQVLLDYNTPWLKAGLHVVLGHVGLDPDEENEKGEENQDPESELAFLRLIIEKHFLAHSGLAKAHATNKSIEGLYRPGYYDALGRLILKRFLLLVLTLDKAKGQNTLEPSLGVDGLDGGSPLLFHRNASVKSSRQALQDFLLSAMHGEGDLIGHLGVLGYHVSHVQGSLPDYDFKVTNLPDDLQDGVRLCRLVQVMLGDPSLLTTVKVPINHRRQRVHNCAIAIQKLKSAGVPLTDEHGYSIIADDIADGNKEKLLALLWNVMLYLQMPTLVNNQKIMGEIAQINNNNNRYDVRSSFTTGRLAMVDLLLKWTQAICACNGYTVTNFTSSFADGRAFCYLLNFYLPAHLPLAAIQHPKPLNNSKHKSLQRCLLQEALDVHETETLIHNFGLVQRITQRLGMIPEVLQVADMIDGKISCSERNIIIFVAYLSSHLVGDKSSMEQCLSALGSPDACSSSISSIDSEVIEAAEEQSSEYLISASDLQNNAATQIQCMYRAYRDRKICIRKAEAIVKLQSLIRGHLARLQFWTIMNGHREKEMKSSLELQRLDAIVKLQSLVKGWLARIHYRRAITESRFQAATLIQAHFRGWFERYSYNENCNRIRKIQGLWRARTVRQKFLIQRQSCLTIQYMYRAYCERKMHKRSREAIVKIQSLIRGHLARVQFQTIMNEHRKREVESSFELKQSEAIVKLQSLMKGWLTRIHYRRAIIESRFQAATVIQAHFRGWFERYSYSANCNRIQKIQGLWRAHTIRKKFLIQRQACLTIQCMYRSYRERQMHKSCREAVVKIQSVIRGHLAKVQFQTIMDEHRKREAESRFELKQSEAIVKLQSLVKGWLTRIHYRRAIIESRFQAATLIQAHFRGWFERYSYSANCNRIRKVQGLWRAHTVRKKFLIQRQACLTIQCMHRSYRERQMHKRNREAVVKIQSLIRGHLAKVQFQTIMNEHRKREMESRFELKQSEAIVKLQSLVKGWLTRIHYRRALIESRFQAATLIQAHFRGWFERYSYSAKCNRIRKIQGLWRAHIVRKKFLIQRQACLTIQCMYRSYRERQMHKRSREAVVKIQSLIRGHLARVQFQTIMNEHREREAESRFELKQSEAIVKLQSLVKGWLTRIHYRRAIIESRFQAATLIQAHFRGWFGRYSYSANCNRIRKIQGLWRAHTVHKKFLIQRQACLTIQCMYRSYSERQKHKRSREAVVKIQSLIRGHLAKVQFQTIMNEHRKREMESRFELKQSEAIVKLQSLVKGWLTRIHYRRALIESRFQAATLIQAHFRGWFERYSYSAKCNRIRKIQGLWRAHTVRKKFLIQRQACLTIQCMYRSYRERQMHKRSREAVVKIQSLIRGHLARVQFQTMMNEHREREAESRFELKQSEAIVKLQSLVKGWLTRIHYQRAIIESRYQAATLIQAHFRGWFGRYSYSANCNRIRKIQGLWRAHTVRKKFLIQRQACLTIQCMYRSYRERQKHKRRREAVVKIQSLIRGHLARVQFQTIMNEHRKREAESRFELKQLEAIVKLQSLVKGWLARIHYQRVMNESRIQAATLIQTHFRGWFERSAYSENCDRIQKIQGLWRTRAVRKKFLLQRQACLTIQCYWKASIAQRLVRTRKAELYISAVKLQTWWRMLSQRRIFMRKKRAAVLIQSYYCTHLRKQRYRMIRESAVKIQSCYRAHRVIKNYMKLLQSVVTIQSYYRTYVHVKSYNRLQGLQKAERVLFNQRLHATLIIQKHVRGWLACRRTIKANKCAMLIQARWRGYLTRLGDGKTQQQLLDLRLRMQNTAANVDNSMRLENRLTAALEALLSQKMVSGILQICATIDVATQHSKLCCERLISAGAITKILQLIQTTNRSPPHQQILKHALSILANLSYYQELAKLVAEAPGSIPTIAEQLFRGHDEVFTKAVKALQLVCKVQSGLEAMRKMPHLLRKIQGLCQSLEKKVEAEMRSLPRGGPGERRVKEAMAQHRSVVHILQTVTGADLQTRLKALKRLSCYHAIPGPAPSNPRWSSIGVGRGTPLYDRSNL